METRVLILGCSGEEQLKIEHILSYCSLQFVGTSNTLLSEVKSNAYQAILLYNSEKQLKETVVALKAHTSSPIIAIGPDIGHKQLMQCIRKGLNDYILHADIEEELPALIRPNITARHKEAEKEKRFFDKQFLQRTKELTKIGSWQFDLQTGTVIWDDLLYEIFEAAHDFEPDYESYIGTIAEESRQVAVNAIQKAIQEKGSFMNQYSVTTFKGNQKHIRSWGEAITDANGNVTGMVGVCMDNTERKNLEYELQAIQEVSSSVSGEEYFKTMTNLLCTQLGVYCAVIGEYFEKDHAAKTLSASANGRNIENFCYDLTDNPCGDVYKSGISVFSNELKEKFPDFKPINDLKPESYVGIPLVRNDQYIGHIVVMDTKPITNPELIFSTLNIIATKCATEILQIKRTREIKEYERHFSLSADIMCIGNTKGYFTKVNSTLVDLLGYSEEELLTIPFMEFVHPDDVELSVAAQQSITRKNTSTKFVNRIKCKDGSYKHLMWTADVDLNSGLIYASAKDVTELKMQEEELSRINTKLNNIFDYANVGIAYATHDGKIESLNDQFAEILEYSDKTEIIGLEIGDFTHPEDLEEDLNLLVAIKAGEIDSFKLEKRYITKNKNIRWVDLRVSSIRDQNGKVINFVGMAIDITEREKIESARREAATRLNLATDAAQIGIWDWDFIENELKLDANMYSIFNVEEDEFDGSFEAWEKIALPEDIPATKLLLERAINGEEDFVTQFRIRNKNGEIRHIKANAIVQKNSEDVPYRMIGLSYDITEQVELLKSVEESERRYRSLFERINEGFLLTTSLGVINAVNPAFCKMLGYEFDELINKQGYFLLADQNDIPILRKKVEERRKGKFEQYDLRLRTKSGKVNWYKFSASPHYNQEGEFIGVMSIVMDITEAKEVDKIKADFTAQLERKVRERTNELNLARKELALSLAKEKELGNLKSKFVATASHQFRTPLTVIQSSIDILTMQRHLMSEEMHPIFDRSVRRVKGQIEKMVELMNDVLSLGKISEGNIQAQKAPTDLLQLCDGIVSNYNEIFSEKCKMDFIIEGEPEPMVLDKKLMEHAISNLVSNAFKYSPENSVSEFKISFNGSVKISVKDYGIGIPKDAQATLFEPFFRAQNAAYVSGTGLGTTIAKEYIEMNGGKIHVISEVGKGSEFIITLCHKSRLA